MAGVAIVFSGQGAQYPGMGRSLYETSEAARRVLDRAEALRPGTLGQCFEGPAEALTRTANTQPCMFAVELAAAAALTEAGVSFDAAAGFSLGEIAALTFSGAVDFDEGFALVCRRGELMDAAAQQTDAAMAAVLKLDAQQVVQLCEGFAHIWPVNFNCPGQVTVSGLREEMAQFLPAVKAAGGLGKLLKVSGGFHSPLMEEAAQQFGAFLAQFTLKTPAMPLYANCTGLPYGADAKPLLTRQICSPVLWQSTIEHMHEAGIDTFVEAGPGSTLCGLIRRTLPGAAALPVSDEETYRTALEALKAC